MNKFQVRMQYVSPTGLYDAPSLAWQQTLTFEQVVTLFSHGRVILCSQLDNSIMIYLAQLPY